MTEPTTEEKPAEKAPSGGGTSKAVILIAIVNLLAVGGLAAYLVLFQKPASPAAAQPQGAHAAPAEGGHGAPAEGGHGESAGGHGGGEGEAVDSGAPILALEPLVTNLADADSDRYLKVTIQLRIKSEAARAEVEAHIVPVRSAILMYLSSLTVADTKGSDKKREIQQQVKRLGNETLPTSRITQVYFTEFVIQ
jgi:flagellar FliL protein